MSYVLCFALLLGITEYAFCCDIITSGVSATERKIIIDKHNSLRDLISQGKVPGQPMGLNLKKMQWDDQLAVEAQKHANECIFKHKIAPDPRWEDGVGQNIWIGRASWEEGGTDWNWAIQDWFDEYKLYTFSESFVMIDGTGHYTQLVWADTTHVGCGYTYYKEGNTGLMYKKLYTCNYGPGGNVLDDLMYEPRYLAYGSDLHSKSYKWFHLCICLIPLHLLFTSYTTRTF